MTAATATRTCTRCDGHGRIQAFAHVNNGICALCGGSGTRPARKGATTNPRHVRKAPAKTGANQRLWDAFAAAHPAEAQIIADGKDTNDALAYAYSYVATWREADSRPRLALDIVADYLTR